MAPTISSNRSAQNSSASARSASLIAESDFGQTAQACWNENSATDADVHKFIYETGDPVNTGPTSPPPISQFQNIDYGSWKSAPNSKCHASFGDLGTTATIGAFGQLLQFSDYLGAGSSGVFSADHAATDEPNLVVHREDCLQEMSQQPFHFDSAGRNGRSYGLSFPNLVMKPDAQPQLKWAHWKWPRHEYSLGDFRNHPNLKLTMQWTIHEKVVLQQCLLENHGDEEIEVDVEFCKSMIIRDLDHLQQGHSFNSEGTRSHANRPGPKGYSWVCVHKFHDDDLRPRSTGPNNDPRGSAAYVEPRFWNSPSRDSSAVHEGQRDEPEHSDPFHEEDIINEQRSKKAWTSTASLHGRKVELNNTHAVAVVASVAIDGKMQLFEDRDTPQKWRLVVTNRQMSDRHARALEVITAYKMSLFETTKTEWEAAVTPFRKMDVNGFLRDHVPLYPLSVVFAALEEPRRDSKQMEKDPFDGSTAKASEDISPADPREDDRSIRNKAELATLTSPVGTPGRSSPRTHLEFAIRRNLDHILSVCTIHATPEVPEATMANSLPDAIREVEAVALTCGDMSGHRICWSASFFAFRFLIEVYKTLDRSRDRPYAVPLLDRIKATCHGHLKWLHLTHIQNGKQSFGPSYWATGRLSVLPESSASRLAGASLLDTGFQILKAAACMEAWPEDDFAAELMSQWALPWVASMENLDVRRKYAWPHSMREGVSTFRLDDHVWIWRALKSLEIKNYCAWDLMFEKAPPPKSIEEIPAQRSRQNRPESLPDRQRTGDTSPIHMQLSKDDIERLSKTFASEIVYSEVSKRFTTENDDALQRMIAVTRSRRESRFLLHARDTALFYDETSDHGLFNFFSEDTRTIWYWERTINFQKSLQGNQESDWESPLRYALAIMMGTRAIALNQKEPDELVWKATEVLFRSYSPNGVFPGQLQLATNEPVQRLQVIQRSRNSSYHASFEIPYILLTHASQISRIFNRLKTQPTTAANFNLNANRRAGGEARRQGIELMQQFFQRQPDARPRLDNTSAEQLQILMDLLSAPLPQLAGDAIDGHEIWAARRQPSNGRPLAPKKTLLFNEPIVHSNIVRIEDDWLWDYPEFFMRDKPLSIRDYNEALVAFDIAMIASDASSGQMTSGRTGKSEVQFCMVDVPSSKTIGTLQNRRPSYTNGDNNRVLWACLSPVRTVRASRKRLIHFTKLTRKAAVICYAGTESSERSSLLGFFERHSSYEKVFIDKCSMKENLWETELHLSHYQLVGQSITTWPGIPEFQYHPLPAGRGRQITRVSTGFRFKGDFADRSWTGYLLEYNPQDSIALDAHRFPSLDSTEKRQRKVLEQLYFQTILARLTISIDDIWAEVKLALGIESERFSISIPNYNAYTSWSSLWQLYEPFLRLLEDDLASTLLIVNKWQQKGEGGGERPQWTQSKERKYRAQITKIRLQIKSQTNQLQRLHENVKSLRESCSNGLEKARGELSFRSEQNIASFTYVTVVFLPLGFATSIFSMNGHPGTSLVISMLTASVVALSITVIALMNAKVLAGIVEDITSEFSKLTTNTKGSSVMANGGKRTERKDMAPHAGSFNPAPLNIFSKSPISWNLIFWIGYIFIEVPARMIAPACRALGWPPQDGRDLDARIQSEPTKPVAYGHSATTNSILSVLTHATQFILGPLGQAVTYLGELQKQTIGYGHWKKVARVLLGLLILPIFIATWFLQVLYFIVLDLLVLLGELVNQGLNAFLPGAEESDNHLISRLTEPHRPVIALKEYLWPRDTRTT